jgi:hypothetical protein
MQKRKFTERVQLLGKARAHYLEFLRNLTPQILLFSFVLISGSKLDFAVIDVTNWHGTLLFYLLITYFGLAVYANSSLFYEKCFNRNSILARRVSLVIKRKKYPPHRWAAVQLCEVWKRRKVEFIEMLVVFYLLQVALAVVVVIGIRTAMQFLNK